MTFPVVLLALASLVLSAFGALPAPGGPYLIVNAQTSFVFDDSNEARNAGNPINGFSVNPSAPDAQFIFIKQTGTCGNTGIYTFTIPTLGLSIYSNGFLGGGLTAQNFTSEFLVTETPAGSGSFLITYPFSAGNLAVTTTPVLRNQLTLQPGSAANPLQKWQFVLQAGVCSALASATLN